MSAEQERDIHEVLSHLSDPQQTIKLGDVAGLSDLDSDEVAVLRMEWDDIDVAQRRWLAQSMQELAEESLELDFRAAFIALLDDDDAVVRNAAARGLIEDTRRSTLSRLLRVLTEDRDESVQAAVALTLGAWTLRSAEGNLNEAAARELETTLLQVFHAPSTATEVRRRILEVLGYLGDVSDVVQAIEDARLSPDIAWQQSSLCAMGRTGMPQWLPLITTAFAADDPALRYEAARAAGELADVAQPVVNQLTQLIADEDVQVATTAIWSLGQIGGESARRVLQRLAKEADGARRDAAAEALHELEFFNDPVNTMPLDDDDDDDWEEFDPEVN